MQRHLNRTADSVAGVGGDLELEVILTDDGLALLPSEVDLLGIARGTHADQPSAVIADAIVPPLERLGRLTARGLERLAEDTRLDPHDAADRAWLIVSSVLRHADDLNIAGDAPLALEPAVNAFRHLDAYAHAHDERVDHRTDELDRLRDTNTALAARHARLERLIAAVLLGAGAAGGADAFEGRYEQLGHALKALEEQRGKP